MNLTQILAVNFGSVLLNVLAIIGIIVAGGFLIFFLGDLLLSILDPENSALKSKKKEEKVMEEYLPYQEQQRLQESEKQEYLSYAPYKKTEEKYEEVDYNKALEEKKLLQETEQPVEVVENPSVVINEIPEKNEDDMFAQLRAEEEAFKQEKLKAATQKQDVFADVKKEESESNEYNFDDIFFNDDFDFDDIDFDDDDDEEIEEVSVIEEKAEEEVEEKHENFEEIENDINQKNQENEDLKAELERKIAELEELKAKTQEEKDFINQQKLEAENEKERLAKENEALEQMLEKIKEEKTPVQETKPQLSLEEYEERLVVLQDRLKLNEKELRAIKKEYLPLMRVRKNLDNDKKKLRRREALVAKQKVILYGVNNIGDIDDERAKKLAQDLDLLDGLRLSVQHCEEVIKNSEERYPILETSYRILTTTVKEIKDDIEDVELSISKLKADDNQ